MLGVMSWIYRLSLYTAHINNLFNGDWSPNSTLLSGRDTQHGHLDPLLNTDPSLSMVLPTQEAYYRSNIVTPIICDTKYQLCAEGGQDFSPIGGITNLIKWLGGVGFKLVVCGFPLLASDLSGIPGGVIQLDPDSATAQR
jgi:hypothetical protein